MKRTIHGKTNGRPHFVPLAKQAIEALRELRLLTGNRVHVFPSSRGEGRPMSNMTVNAALRRMGFSGDEMTAHGFRAMARTLMIERLPGIHADVIEAQLAHGKSGPLGAAYDRAEYMEQRRIMMQSWADYLDKLRQGRRAPVQAGMTPGSASTICNTRPARHASGLFMSGFELDISRFGRILKQLITMSSCEILFLYVLHVLMFLCL